MKVGILTALDEEAAGLLALLDRRAEQIVGQRSYFLGRLSEVDVVIVSCGMGKVAAAAATTTLKAVFCVDIVLLIGVAGSADKSLKLGDVIVADALVQHDMDVSALSPYKRFEVPLLDISRFKGIETLNDNATQAIEAYIYKDTFHDLAGSTWASFGIDEPQVHRGLIASGDRFIADSVELAGIKVLLPDLLCVEMEGAAVAQVCHVSESPFLVVRIISDRADSEAPVDFTRFLREVASPMIAGVTQSILGPLLQHCREASLTTPLPSAMPQRLIEALSLAPHPEGGWYRETWRQFGHDGKRASATAILFLLEAGQRSHWHRVDAAEMWLWHAGSSMTLRVADERGSCNEPIRLGPDVLAGARPQHLLAPGVWQEACADRGWVLVSCVVSPGFEFSGFELAPENWEPGDIKEPR